RHTPTGFNLQDVSVAKLKSVTTQASVAQTAVQCFMRRGVSETTMAHIARAHGVSRQTVYRMFASRGDLLQYIIVDRVREQGESEFPTFANYKSLAEALIEGSILGLSLVRGDSLLKKIVQEPGDHSIDQFMFRGSEVIQNMMLKLWKPVLNRARATGELRPGLSNEQVVEWIRNVHALLTFRDDYDDAKLREVLQEFLVPSLVNQTYAPKKSGTTKRK